VAGRRKGPDRAVRAPPRSGVRRCPAYFSEIAIVALAVLSDEVIFSDFGAVHQKPVELAGGR
jgi:hypothetical protein